VDPSELYKAVPPENSLLRWSDTPPSVGGTRAVVSAYKLLQNISIIFLLCSKQTTLQIKRPFSIFAVGSPRRAPTWLASRLGTKCVKWDSTDRVRLRGRWSHVFGFPHRVFCCRALFSCSLASVSRDKKGEATSRIKSDVVTLSFVRDKQTVYGSAKNTFMVYNTHEKNGAFRHHSESITCIYHDEALLEQKDCMSLISPAHTASWFFFSSVPAWRHYLEFILTDGVILTPILFTSRFRYS
jgi:hypothetical protein